MTKLVAIFRRYITKCGEGEAGSKYKASNLKKRLQKSHPQLVFHSPSRRNKSEFVFVEDLSAGLLAEHFDLSEEDDEEECYSPDTSMSNTDENNRAHLYRAAII